MKVFSVMNSQSAVETSRKGRKGKRGGKKAQASNRPPRQNLSRDEILKKVQLNKTKQTSTPKKTDAKFEKQSKMMNFPEDADREAVGDVGLNNPNDPTTIGKLKILLERGGINFSDKEKSALSKIVEDRG